MSERPTRVTGIGGVFFKARDPAALGRWYRDHLGIEVADWGGASFAWRDAASPEKLGATIWSPFKEDTSYFAPSEKSFMINYRVDDLDAVLADLEAEGCTIDAKRESTEFGKFGWVMDPEGNRIELWQPPE